MITVEITLKQAGLSDAEKLHKMQTEAFAGLLAHYKDYNTNPGNEPLEKTIRRLREPFTYFYFILKDEITVGAIRVVDKDNNEAKKISPLFIIPEYRNNGFAQAAIIEAEKIHGNSNWQLDTILQEKGNCYLYEKMGYKKTGKTQKINDIMTLIFYEK